MYKIIFATFAMCICATVSSLPLAGSYGSGYGSQNSGLAYLSVPAYSTSYNAGGYGASGYGVPIIGVPLYSAPVYNAPAYNARPGYCSAY